MTISVFSLLEGRCSKIRKRSSKSFKKDLESENSHKIIKGPQDKPFPISRRAHVSSYNTSHERGRTRTDGTDCMCSIPERMMPCTRHQGIRREIIPVVTWQKRAFVYPAPAKGRNLIYVFSPAYHRTCKVIWIIWVVVRKNLQSFFLS